VNLGRADFRQFVRARFPHQDLNLSLGRTPALFLLEVGSNLNLHPLPELWCRPGISLRKWCPGDSNLSGPTTEKLH